MPDTAQWVAIAIAILTGSFSRDIISWIKDGVQGRNAARRTEVDRAIGERDKARKERDTAQELAAWEARWARILEESLGVHRRRMIDAPCIDPDNLPQYPTQPDKD